MTKSHTLNLFHFVHIGLEDELFRCIQLGLLVDSFSPFGLPPFGLLWNSSRHDDPVRNKIMKNVYLFISVSLFELNDWHYVSLFYTKSERTTQNSKKMQRGHTTPIRML